MNGPAKMYPIINDPDGQLAFDFPKEDGYEAKLREFIETYKKEAVEWRKEAERLESAQKNALELADTYADAADQFIHALEEYKEKETIV